MLVFDVHHCGLQQGATQEEVTQDNIEEIPEDQLGDEENYGATGRVKIIPDATINEADTESMRNIRIMNANLDEDALSDISEVSEDDPQTGATVRKMRTSNPEDVLTDEKAEQVLRTLEEVIQNRANKNRTKKQRQCQNFRK